MNKMQIETLGKVFVVVRGMRRCLICDRVFTPMEAAEHAATMCFPSSSDAVAPCMVMVSGSQTMHS
jgi:hypothetical protein